METNKLGEINRNIAEIKKRILLSEGQKAANTAEWQKQNRINLETISTLKKEIKELTSKYTLVKNPPKRAILDKESNADLALFTEGEALGKGQYPPGAKTVDEAIFLSDLKVTETRKQLDLLHHKYQCKRKVFNRLFERYNELLATKEHKDQEVGGNPAETLEEDANRKLVCRLENDIHRTNVQWMEAEHIRKKYRSIEASLMADAERFERSLKELEVSLNEQQAEINRLQQVHNEAVEMRDAAKVILQRQEQQANISLKTRERQAMEFRKQVELRKLELERIGRKLFFDGKTFTHQDSIGSSSGDQHTAKTDKDDDPNSHLQGIISEMESTFKNLMEVTGATTPSEVLERFLSQKESTLRLNYLRNAAEAEKNDLEIQREKLSRELDASKFSDVKESDVNQEAIELIKSEIASLRADEHRDLEAAEQTECVLKFIEERLREMIYKLQEVDENDIVIPEKQKIIHVDQLPDFLVNDATHDDLINVLTIKLQRGLQLAGQEGKQSPVLNNQKLEIQMKEDELFEPFEKPTSPIATNGEKPQPLPMCYYNLISGRAARMMGTSSSSPEQGPLPAAATDDESEVPSRNFLKRQSVLIVDSKSRRKPFRSAPIQRRK